MLLCLSNMNRNIISMVFLYFNTASGFVITFMTTTFPYPFYYTTGSDIAATCWLPPSTHTFQHWTHPTGEYISTTNGRYLIRRDQFSVTLSVTNGQVSDSGSYTCHAMVGSESVTSSVSAHFSLPIQVYSTSANATVNVGGSFNFSCNATDFIQRQWVSTSPFSRPAVVRSTTDGRITITENFELLVTDARFEDEGMYECRLVNNIGSIKLKNNLSVIAHPEVVVEKSYKEVMANSSVTLNCNVTGVPLPYVIWKDKFGQVLESSDELVVSNSTVSSSTVTGSLTFHQVRSHQTGLYTCCGINRYATSMANINLRLHGSTPHPLISSSEATNMVTKAANMVTEAANMVTEVTNMVTEDTNLSTKYLSDNSALTGQQTVSPRELQHTHMTTTLEGEAQKAIPYYVYIIMAGGGLLSFFTISVLSLLLGLYVCKSRTKKQNPQTKDFSSSKEMCPSNNFQDVSCTADTTSRHYCSKVDETIDNMFSILPKSLLIQADAIVLKDEIGRGEFGTVYSADLLIKGKMQDVAVKRLNGNRYSATSTVKKVMDEITKMECLNHPNVMSLLGVCLEEVAIGIVMPRMAESLLDYLRNNRKRLKPLSSNSEVESITKELLQICWEIAKGMEYLAMIKFVHRDLAARNCMLDHKHQVKVSDFGLTEDVYTVKYFQQDSNSDFKLPLMWMALESLQLGKFSEKSDVWSFGVTCWETFSGGEIPYPGIRPSAITRYLESGQRLEKPNNKACTDEVYDVMKLCWKDDSALRPQFSGLVVLIEDQLKAVAAYLSVI